jgi:hypothetical protein
MKKFLRFPQAPEWLLNLPESGYGYQVIKAGVSAREAEILEGPLVILNSLIVVPLNRAMVTRGEWITIEDFIEHEEVKTELFSENSFLTDARYSPPISSHPERLFPIEEFHTELLTRIASAAFPSAAFPATARILPATGSTLTLTRSTGRYEGFIRYSHLPVDPRVCPLSGAGPAGTSVRAGTYTTPWRDGVTVNSGFSAVGRYALPVPLPSSYARVLVPPDSTPVRIGTAVPLFGQAGGGVEAFFPAGFIHQAQDAIQLPDF